MRDEWAKIQGRFVDLAVNAGGEEQVDLISRAIESDHRPKAPSGLSRTVAALVHPERSTDAERLALMLECCWPLHPVVASLLGPISRRRFGQNQRSIFGFLNSAEPHGFQDFLKREDDDALYGPDKLWDYLRANLEPSILASPDGHRWALAAEALERCESIGGDALHIRLLKTIAIIDLCKERSGLVPSIALLRTCFPETPEKSLMKALDQLNAWSLTLFKKFLSAYAIYAGSDFDIDEAVRTALAEVDAVVGARQPSPECVSETVHDDLLVIDAYLPNVTSKSLCQWIASLSGFRLRIDVGKQEDTITSFSLTFDELQEPKI